MKKLLFFEVKKVNNMNFFQFESAYLFEI